MGKIAVAPLVGAWIEIPPHFRQKVRIHVAPLVGAWIEIIFIALLYFSFLSLPLWERGLKCNIEQGTRGAWHVAPLVGAWIEMGK